MCLCEPALCFVCVCVSRRTRDQIRAAFRLLGAGYFPEAGSDGPWVLSSVGGGSEPSCGDYFLLGTCRALSALVSILMRHSLNPLAPARARQPLTGRRGSHADQ